MSREISLLSFPGWKITAIMQSKVEFQPCTKGMAERNVSRSSGCFSRDDVI